MQATYANGRAAVFRLAQCELKDEALHFTVDADAHVWAYADLARADDGNGRIVLKLKRKPDTGERLALDQDCAGALRAIAPALFKPRAFGVESPYAVAGVFAGAWAMAGLFLVGIPYLAQPIAEVLPPAYREQVSEISWSQIGTQICDDSDAAEAVLNAAAARMMEAANVESRDSIWISIVDEGFPNAFALPDNSIIVTDDLIQMAEDPDEVMGVIAHEIAHVEHNHVMAGIIRQMGAGIFFDIMFGGAGVGQVVAVASVNLTGLRYSRGAESEADASGFDYLDAGGISTSGVARLFDRMQQMQEDAHIGDIPTMLSSHPATRERAAAARARARPGLRPSLSDSDWRTVRQACGGSSTPAETAAQPGEIRTPQAP